MIQIKVTDSIYQEKTVTLNKTSFTFRITFNTSDDSWYLDIADRKGVDIINGIKILPYQLLTDKYLVIKEALGGGSLYCYNNASTDAYINRDNFGTDKQYQLLYWNAEEVAEYESLIG